MSAPTLLFKLFHKPAAPKTFRPLPKPEPLALTLLTALTALLSSILLALILVEPALAQGALTDGNAELREQRLAQAEGRAPPPAPAAKAAPEAAALKPPTRAERLADARLLALRLPPLPR